VLLFARLDPLGVAWLRIAAAAALFALARRPWQLLRLGGRAARLVWAWGAVLGVMNCCFYVAIARLPLGTVAAIEFVPVVVLAAVGLRTRRNLAALALATVGVAVLTQVTLAVQPWGLALALLNAVLFGCYIVLGHRAAQAGAGAGIDALAAAMVVAALIVTPVGVAVSWPTVFDPFVLLAGAGVAVTSSVIPYVTDQLAMARLPRSTYALLSSLLPATATVIGLLVLHQRPSLASSAGIALVIAAVALRRDDQAR
jgi:inner membrane transporter RhtA